jgi:hypothetical protein
MFIVDLSCEHGHRFEGWYDSSSEFTDVRDAGNLSCPLCKSKNITQELSTGSIRTTKTNPLSKIESGGNAPDAKFQGGDEDPMPLPTQRALSQLIRWVQNTHEDVGDDFYNKAMAIHHGQIESKAIYGQVTNSEERKLEDEGVPILKIPIPDIEKN